MKDTKRNLLHRLLACFLLLAMLAAVAMSAVGCGNDSETTDPDGETSSAIAQQVCVTLIVKNKAGLETFYDVTAKEGDSLLSAMLQCGILKEDGIKDGMVLTLNGETADYSVDQSYWAFTMNAEYMMTGAEDTVLTDGAVYQFTYTVFSDVTSQ